MDILLCLNLDDGVCSFHGEESGRLLNIFLGFPVVVGRLDEDCETAKSDECDFEQHLVESVC